MKIFNKDQKIEIEQKETTRQKKQQIRLVLSNELYDQIKAVSSKNEQTMAGWCKYLIMKELIKTEEKDECRS